MAEVGKKRSAGLIDRAIGVLGVTEAIPDKISDEEAEGLIRVLPPDSANNMKAAMVPRIRVCGIGALKMVGKWLRTAREAQEQGKKVILVPFNFPVELIHAFENAVPLTSEVLSSVASVVLEGKGDRYWDTAMGLGLPDHVCSSNTI